MLAATPPMGWNSWNTFGPNIDQDLIIETADAMVDEGLLGAGYNYLVIDDVWMAPERVDGRLAPDPKRFSAGIGWLADEVHARGLKFGIYSSAGTHTCEELPASFGYEDIDAQTFAEWGVDFLKYDYCFTAAGSDPVALYRRMGQALRSSGRDIVYSICEWGVNQPWKWGPSIGAHMWRTTEDIFDEWPSVAKLGFQLQQGLHSYSGPGRWNDPDMLVVGMHGKGHVGRGGLTDAEYRSHFAQWCLLASPLMVGCDVRNMDEFTRNLLLDPELIAINQDSLGRQAHRMNNGTGHGEGEVWGRPLADGSWAVGFFNTTEKENHLMTIGLERLGIPDTRPVSVTDMRTGVVTTDITRSFAARVDVHDVAVVRISPN